MGQLILAQLGHARPAHRAVRLGEYTIDSLRTGQEAARRRPRPGGTAPRIAAERRRAEAPARIAARLRQLATDRLGAMCRARRRGVARRVGAVVEQERPIAHRDEVLRAVPRSSGDGACPASCHSAGRDQPVAEDAGRAFDRLRFERHDRVVRTEEVRQVHRAAPAARRAAAPEAVAPHRPVARPPGSPASVERVDFLGRRAGRARNDRTRVSHAPARRRRPPGNEADDGLRSCARPRIVPRPAHRSRRSHRSSRRRSSLDRLERRRDNR